MILMATLAFNNTFANRTFVLFVTNGFTRLLSLVGSLVMSMNSDIRKYEGGRDVVMLWPVTYDTVVLLFI